MVGHTEQELLDEIDRLARASGRTPTIRMMIEHGKYSQDVYYSHFGSWNEALRRAGREPNRRGSFRFEPNLDVLEGWIEGRLAENPDAVVYITGGGYRWHIYEDCGYARSDVETLPLDLACMGGLQPCDACVRRLIGAEKVETWQGETGMIKSGGPQGRVGDTGD